MYHLNKKIMEKNNKESKIDRIAYKIGLALVKALFLGMALGAFGMWLYMK